MVNHMADPLHLSLFQDGGRIPPVSSPAGHAKSLVAYKWVCLCNFVIKSAYAPFTNHSQKKQKANERVSQILDK